MPRRNAHITTKRDDEFRSIEYWMNRASEQRGEKDFEELVGLLNEHTVRYLMVGLTP